MAAISIFSVTKHITLSIICIATLILVQHNTELPISNPIQVGSASSERMETTHNNQTDTLDTMKPHIYAAVYSLFFIVGFPANCLSLYVAWILRRKGNSTAVYLINLSISDLLYTISLPVWIELALHRPVSDGLCSSVAVVMYNSFYAGSGFLCCISVDRYLAVVYPLHFHCVREMRTTALMSIAVWILEIIIHIILLHHTGALHAFSSRRLCEEQKPKMTKEDANIAITRVILGFLVPVIIMTFCFQRIMHSLQQSTSLQAEERRKVGVLLLALLLTYIVAYVPYQTVMVLRAILESRDCKWARLLSDPYLATVTATTLNSAIDPIIYCLISESAKKEIKKIVMKGREVFMKKWSVSSTIQSVA